METPMPDPALRAVPDPHLRPDPHDEAGHPPGVEGLWNESWYFDWVSEDGALGGYVRLGLYPNLGVAWYTAVVTGADRPTIAVTDLRAPLPEEGALRTQTDAIAADLVCDRPLERFAVTCAATGQLYEDPAAILRGEPGVPSDVELDLAWDTDGEPYRYRITTRYEIPCRVTGSVVVEGERHEVRGFGQRDHSWGVRDWWAMNWCWMAGRLDDESRLHAVHMRLPGIPPFGIGYVQGGGRDLLELTTDGVDVTEEVDADGLPVSATLRLDPPGMVVEVQPIAHGPLRLVSDDGRLSRFPRVMCALHTGDGRTGHGWIEWNLNEART
jgi:hypothetical protein